MTDLKVITTDDLFDIPLTQQGDATADSTGESLITTALFSQPWWADPNAGSRFEETADNIITNDTRININAVLKELQKEIPLDNLKFDLTIKIDSVSASAAWVYNNQIIRTNF